MRLHDSQAARRFVVVLAGALLLPLAAGAQSVSGQATSVLATVNGVTSTIGSTGWLADINDARGASSLGAPIPLLGSVESLESVTISSAASGSPAAEVSSMASLANLALSVASQAISADYILASVRAPVSGAPTPSAIISGLSVNGTPVAVTGAPNQVVSLPGLTMVVNEVTSGASGTTVNALHISSLDGLVNVVVASATAGYTAASSGGLLGGL